MILSVFRVPDTRIKRLTATIYAYAFFDELILLYPVYTLLLADNGLSVAEISSLFILWSLTSIVLEVPSGALADAVSRRRVLAVAPLLAAVGFAMWPVTSSYWVFALGFVLWGVQGALQSGAFEALVYEELDRLGAADRYARIMGRSRAWGVAAVIVALTAGGPVLALGGYAAVGVASVLACVVTAAVALALPEHRRRRSAALVGSPSAGEPVATSAGVGPAAAATGVLPVTAPPDDEVELGYLATLRAGLAEARHSRSVRWALVVVPAVTAIWGSLEEYVPLLAVETGVPNHLAPFMLLLVWGGVTIGGLLAGVGQRMNPTTLAGALALGALAMAAGALSGVPAGFVLIAVAFCVFQVVSVVADARLQERITGPSRATVTSLAGLGTELAAVAVYGAYAAASAMSHSTVFALFAGVYVVIAVGLAAGGRGPRVAGV